MSQNFTVTLYCKLDTALPVLMLQVHNPVDAKQIFRKLVLPFIILLTEHRFLKTVLTFRSFCVQSFNHVLIISLAWSSNVR